MFSLYNIEPLNMIWRMETVLVFCMQMGPHSHTTTRRLGKSGFSSGRYFEAWNASMEKVGIEIDGTNDTEGNSGY
jgi:hypothetical protein